MSYICLIIYMIFTYLRPQEIYSGFSEIPTMFIFGLLTGVFLLKDIITGNYNLVKSPQNSLMVGLLISIVLSQLLNLYFQGTYIGLVEFTKTTLLYFYIVNIINTELKIKSFAGLLIVLSTYLAVQGIIQYYGGIGLAQQTMIEGRIRYISIFGDPNDLALAINMFLPFYLFNIFDNNNKYFNIIVLVMFVISVYAIWLTNSRGGILTFGAVMGLYFVKRKGKFKAFIITLVITVFIFIAAPSRMSTISPGEESAHGRIIGMATGIWLMKTNLKTIFFGAGYNAFNMDYGYVAHNSIMHVVGETGIIGLFFWMSLMYVSLKGVYLINNVSNKDIAYSFSRFSSVIFIGIIGFNVGAFFLSRAFNPLLYVLHGMAAAANNIYNIKYSKEPNKINKFKSDDMIKVFMGEFMILIIIYIIVRIYY